MLLVNNILDFALARKRRQSAVVTEASVFSTAVFSTVEQGLQGTPNGDFFTVVDDDPTTYASIYKHVDGQAIAITQMKTLVDDIFVRHTRRMEFFEECIKLGVGGYVITWILVQSIIVIANLPPYVVG